jgi:hypothetical protein
LKKVLAVLPIFVVFIFCSSCGSQIERKVKQKNEFLEVRIIRWTALEGGETFVLRKVDKEWTAMLLGDGSRFSCLYQKSVRPKSDWDDLWTSMQKDGLLDIPDGNFTAGGWNDGSGFIVDIFYKDQLKRYSFFLPEMLKTKEARQILDVGNLIGQEFDTPVFVENYDRGKLGDYLIENCKDYRN